MQPRLGQNNKNKKQEGNKKAGRQQKNRKATQFSCALYLLSRGCLEKSRGEEKRVLGNNSPGIRNLQRNTAKTTYCTLVHTLFQTIPRARQGKASNVGLKIFTEKK